MFKVALLKKHYIHPSIVAWIIPWTEEPAGYSPWGHKELDMTEQLTLSLFSFLVNQISMRPVIRCIFEEVVRYVMEVGHLRRW